MDELHLCLLRPAYPVFAAVFIFSGQDVNLLYTQQDILLSLFPISLPLYATMLCFNADFHH